MASLEPSTPPSPPPPTFSTALGRRWRSKRAPHAWLGGGSLPSVLSTAGAGIFARALSTHGRMSELEREAFTIFAPSDEALGELPAQLREDPSRLRRILAYHVVEGVALHTGELARHLDSSMGQRLRLRPSAEGIAEVNDSRVLWPNLRAGQGVIHIIDDVLMPAEFDAIELLHISDNFKRLVTACEIVGVEDLLRGELPYTLLAPRGLTTLPTWRWHQLLEARGHEQLRELIRHHLVPGRHYLDGAAEGAQRIRNLEGAQLPVERVGEDYCIAGRRVRVPNLDTRNGLIHVVDGILR